MRIRRDDVAHVREQTNLADVVAEHVTLKPAGVGSLKGLCPFHDEKTPSFQVRAAVGLYYCFGCGAGGDVLSFIQQLDHLSFAESVEYLASKLGYQLRYEDDDGRSVSNRHELGNRQRLLEVNRVTAQYYAEQLHASADAMPGRQFLAERGFDREASARFAVGFAPRTGEALLKHLRGRSFTEAELVASGVAGRGARGLYDRFRGRLIWPIRDVTGEVVGFGARRLFPDDRIEAKYVNTPETLLYKKSQVLYGVDLAKRDIAKQRQVVVVEGYTDVMACHEAGVPTAVATCGTAFAADHTRLVRRLLGDDRSMSSSGQVGGQVIFTFDGDAAGQRAARRAFDMDQSFVAQTYVAVAADGMDPCDLRLAKGDQAVRELVEARTPLFEFVIRSVVNQSDLDSAEGRIAALRVAAPVVAGIRDPQLRPEYARQVAGWLGMEVEPVVREVRRAAAAERREKAQATKAHLGHSDQLSDQMSVAHTGQEHVSIQAKATVDGFALPDPRDPVARLERAVLVCLIQVPRLVPTELADGLGEHACEVPAYRAVLSAIGAAGGLAVARAITSAQWVQRITDEAPSVVRPLIAQLAVDAIPVATDEQMAWHARDVVAKLTEVELSAQIGMLRSRLQRMTPTDTAYQETFADLLAVETRRRTLQDQLASIPLNHTTQPR